MLRLPFNRLVMEIDMSEIPATNPDAVGVLPAQGARSSSIGTRLTRGVAWSVVAAGGSRALSLLCSIGLARLLGREHFGELGVVQSTIGTFQAFAAFGLGLTAAKYVAELRASDPSRAGRIAALSGVASAVSGAIVAIVMLLTAPWLAMHALDAPQLAGLLRIGGLVLLLTSINSAQLGTLTGFEDFRAVAKFNLLGGILSFPMSLAGAWAGGIEGAMWGQAIALLLTCMGCYFEVRAVAGRSAVRINFRDWGRELRVLFGFSLPAMLGSLMVAPVYWLCLAMLAHHAKGYSELGLFNAANQWRSAILFLPGLLSSVAMPILSNLYGEGDKRRFLKVLRYNLAFAVTTTLLVAGAVVVASPLIMSGYGHGFARGTTVLLPLAISAVISAGLAIVGDAIASSGRMWDGLVLNLIWAAVMLYAAYRLVGPYGAAGLAWGSVIAYLVHFVTVTTYVIVTVGRITPRVERGT